MKTIFYLPLVALLMVPSLLEAQQTEEPRIFWVQEQTYAFPEDGSQAEFDSLSNLLHQNITMKDEKMLSQRVLQHYWGDDSRKLVVIREYRNMEDMLDDTANEELFKASWKTEEERQAFNEAWGKYFEPYHADEIFTEVANTRKN